MVPAPRCARRAGTAGEALALTEALMLQETGEAVEELIREMEEEKV